MGVFANDGAALLWRGGHETVRIEPWGPDSLRVRGTLRGTIRDDLPGALLPAPPGDPPSPDEPPSPGEPGSATTGDGTARISNGRLTAEIAADGRITFRRTGDRTSEPAGDDTELLSEVTPHFTGPPQRRYTPRGSSHQFEVLFNARDGERLYGLGQHQHGRLDQKGAVIDLVQRNTEVVIPFLLSSRGYGFLWNHPGTGRVELGTTATRWVADSTRQWDYWITAGAEPRDILRRYADVTGHAPMLPDWASGFWQCKLRYRTQEELLGVAREFKKRGLPLDVIVVDYFHWTRQGDWRFDPAEWPDPAAMVAELDELGVRLMVSIWPTVNPDSENFQEMAEGGLLVENERGQAGQLAIWDKGADKRVPVSFYDATSPAAREFIWAQAKDGYYKYGIKTWWLDACEPELRPEQPDNLRYHLGPGAEVTGIYPLLNAKAFHDGMTAEGESEIVLLCRSAWAGSQRYGAAVWSGDVDSTFTDLRRQIPAGLNIGLSGIPWWTTDIGGFKGGDGRTPEFRELLVRWFQFGVFSPLCRLHGVRQPGTMEGPGQTGAPNEPWSFGDDVYQILRRWLALRERLRPYIMDTMRAAHADGLPPMRPLFLNFPGDETAWGIDDQFMLGDDILVAPVVTLGARQRRVYLPETGPEDGDWLDAWTGERVPGGQWVTALAPLTTIPVYVTGHSRLDPFRGMRF